MSFVKERDPTCLLCSKYHQCYLIRRIQVDCFDADDNLFIPYDILKYMLCEPMLYDLVVTDFKKFISDEKLFINKYLEVKS